MKLYIPTCTLNFNNIFSTESISPANHYIRRGFGNKRYYKVEANDLDNVILLYSKYPNYHVDNEETENYTLVIEIESEDYPKDKYTKVNERNGVEIYASSSTIYFNPFRCSIYFDSVLSKTSVMTKADQSLENKYSKLYQGNFKLQNGIQTEDSFVWEKSFIDNIIDVESSEVERDIFVDRIKGCFVCYLLGANMSVSKDISRLKRLARMMRNTLSAIFNSPNKRPTETQDETLLSYIKEFNEIYSNVDENSIYNRNVISKRLVSPSTNLDSETIIKVLRDVGAEDYVFSTLNLRPIYDAKDLYNCFYSDPTSSTDSYTNEIKKLFDVIERIERTEQTKKPKENIKELLSAQNSEIKVVDNVAGTGNFISSLLNSQIAGEYKKFMKDNGTGELLSIAFVGGAKLKEFMPDKWEKSEYQIYINSLLANMQDGESFDIFSTDNETMQSFAAFCQKGEDIDRLIDYMLQCGFSKYRFALGIYGATRGFAVLPKTFTNALINGSCDYYIDFYNYLHKILFGFDLKDTVIPNSKKSNVAGEMSNTMTSSGFSGIEKTNHPKEDEFDTTLDRKKSQIPECLKSFFYSEPFQKLKKEEQSYYKNKTLELWDGNYDNDFFSKLKEIQPYGRTKRKWTEMIKQWKCQMKKDPAQQSKITGIEFPVGQYFYNDLNVWSHIEPLIPQKKDRDKISKDLTWFQDEFSKPKGSRGYTYDSVDEFDNKIVIEKFCSLKMGKNDKGQERAPYFPEELREKIKSKLKELYHVN